MERIIVKATGSAPSMQLDVSARCLLFFDLRSETETLRFLGAEVRTAGARVLGWEKGAASFPAGHQRWWIGHSLIGCGWLRIPSWCQAYQRPYSQYNSYDHYGQQYGSQHYGGQQYGHQQSR